MASEERAAGKKKDLSNGDSVLSSSEQRRSERKRKDRPPLFSPDDFDTKRKASSSSLVTSTSSSGTAAIAKKCRAVRSKLPATSAADRPFDTLPNGQPFTCDLCQSPYVCNPLMSKGGSRGKRSRHMPIPRQKVNPATGKLLTLCNACCQSLEGPGPSRRSAGVSPEAKEAYLVEAKAFAADLASRLLDPEAELFYCPGYNKTPCRCLQKYIGAEGKAEQSLERGKELLQLHKQSRKLAAEKVYNLDKVVSKRSSKKQAPYGSIGLGNGHKRSKRFETFVLQQRKRLKHDLHFCEKATQRILCYSNNFLHKKLKTEERGRRAERQKGKAALGLLDSLEALGERYCCVDHCVWMVYSHQNLVSHWRRRAMTSQREARRVLAEMLTPSGGVRCNCYKFIGWVTGCSHSTISKVRAQMRRTKGDREPPLHGLYSFWEQKTQAAKHKGDASATHDSESRYSGSQTRSHSDTSIVDSSSSPFISGTGGALALSAVLDGGVEGQGQGQAMLQLQDELLQQQWSISQQQQMIQQQMSSLGNMQQQWTCSHNASVMAGVQQQVLQQMTQLRTTQQQLAASIHSLQQQLAALQSPAATPHLPAAAAVAADTPLPCNTHISAALPNPPNVQIVAGLTNPPNAQTLSGLSNPPNTQMVAGLINPPNSQIMTGLPSNNSPIVAGLPNPPNSQIMTGLPSNNSPIVAGLPNPPNSQIMTGLPSNTQIVAGHPNPPNPHISVTFAAPSNTTLPSGPFPSLPAPSTNPGPVKLPTVIPPVNIHTTLFGGAAGPSLSGPSAATVAVRFPNGPFFTQEFVNPPNREVPVESRAQPIPSHFLPPGGVQCPRATTAASRTPGHYPRCVQNFGAVAETGCVPQGSTSPLPLLLLPPPPPPAGNSLMPAARSEALAPLVLCSDAQSGAWRGGSLQFQAEGGVLDSRGCGQPSQTGVMTLTPQQTLLFSSSGQDSGQQPAQQPSYQVQQPQAAVASVAPQQTLLFSSSGQESGQQPVQQPSYQVRRSQAATASVAPQQTLLFSSSGQESGQQPSYQVQQSQGAPASVAPQQTLLFSSSGQESGQQPSYQVQQSQGATASVAPQQTLLFSSSGQESGQQPSYQVQQSQGATASVAPQQTLLFSSSGQESGQQPSYQVQQSQGATASVAPQQTLLFSSSGQESGQQPPPNFMLAPSSGPQPTIVSLESGQQPLTVLKSSYQVQQHQVLQHQVQQHQVQQQSHSQQASQPCPHGVSWKPFSQPRWTQASGQPQWTEASGQPPPYISSLVFQAEASHYQSVVQLEPPERRVQQQQQNVVTQQWTVQQQQQQQQTVSQHAQGSQQPPPPPPPQSAPVLVSWIQPELLQQQQQQQHQPQQSLNLFQSAGPQAQSGSSSGLPSLQNALPGPALQNALPGPALQNALPGPALQNALPGPALQNASVPQQPHSGASPGTPSMQASLPGSALNQGCVPHQLQRGVGLQDTQSPHPPHTHSHPDHSEVSGQGFQQAPQQREQSVQRPQQLQSGAGLQDTQSLCPPPPHPDVSEVSGQGFQQYPPQQGERSAQCPQQQEEGSSSQGPQERSDQQFFRPPPYRTQATVEHSLTGFKTSDHRSEAASPSKSTSVPARSAVELQCKTLASSDYSSEAASPTECGSVSVSPVVLVSAVPAERVDRPSAACGGAQGVKSLSAPHMVTAGTKSQGHGGSQADTLQGASLALQGSGDASQPASPAVRPLRIVDVRNTGQASSQLVHSRDDKGRDVCTAGKKPSGSQVPSVRNSTPCQVSLPVASRMVAVTDGSSSSTPSSSSSSSLLSSTRPVIITLPPNFMLAPSSGPQPTIVNTGGVGAPATLLLQPSVDLSQWLVCPQLAPLGDVCTEECPGKGRREGGSSLLSGKGRREGGSSLLSGKGVPVVPYVSEGGSSPGLRAGQRKSVVRQTSVEKGVCVKTTSGLSTPAAGVVALPPPSAVLPLEHSEGGSSPGLRAGQRKSVVRQTSVEKGVCVKTTSGLSTPAAGVVALPPPSAVLPLEHSEGGSSPGLRAGQRKSVVRQTSVEKATSGVCTPAAGIVALAPSATSPLPVYSVKTTAVSSCLRQTSVEEGVCAKTGVCSTAKTASGLSASAGMLALPCSSVTPLPGSSVKTAVPASLVPQRVVSGILPQTCAVPFMDETMSWTVMGQSSGLVPPLSTCILPNTLVLAGGQTILLPTPGSRIKSPHKLLSSPAESSDKTYALTESGGSASLMSSAARRVMSCGGPTLKEVCARTEGCVVMEGASGGIQTSSPSFPPPPALRSAPTLLLSAVSPSQGNYLSNAPSVLVSASSSGQVNYLSNAPSVIVSASSSGQVNLNCAQVLRNAPTVSLSASSSGHATLGQVNFTSGHATSAQVNLNCAQVLRNAPTVSLSASSSGHATSGQVNFTSGQVKSGQVNLSSSQVLGNAPTMLGSSSGHPTSAQVNLSCAQVLRNAPTVRVPATTSSHPTSAQVNLSCAQVLRNAPTMIKSTSDRTHSDSAAHTMLGHDGKVRATQLCPETFTETFSSSPPAAIENPSNPASLDASVSSVDCHEEGQNPKKKRGRRAQRKKPGKRVTAASSADASFDASSALTVEEVPMPVATASIACHPLTTRNLRGTDASSSDTNVLKAFDTTFSATGSQILCGNQHCKRESISSVTGNTTLSESGEKSRDVSLSSAIQVSSTATSTVLASGSRQTARIVEKLVAQPLKIGDSGDAGSVPYVASSSWVPDAQKQSPSVSTSQQGFSLGGLSMVSSPSTAPQHRISTKMNTSAVTVHQSDIVSSPLHDMTSPWQGTSARIVPGHVIDVTDPLTLSSTNETSAPQVTDRPFRVAKNSGTDPSLMFLSHPHTGCSVTSVSETASPGEMFKSSEGHMPGSKKRGSKVIKQLPRKAQQTSSEAVRSSSVFVRPEVGLGSVLPCTTNSESSVPVLSTSLAPKVAPSSVQTPAPGHGVWGMSGVPRKGRALLQSTTLHSSALVRTSVPTHPPPVQSLTGSSQPVCSSATTPQTVRPCPRVPSDPVLPVPLVTCPLQTMHLPQQNRSTFQKVLTSQHSGITDSSKTHHRHQKRLPAQTPPSGFLTKTTGVHTAEVVEHARKTSVLVSSCSEQIPGSSLSQQSPVVFTQSLSSRLPVAATPVEMVSQKNPQQTQPHTLKVTPSPVPRLVKPTSRTMPLATPTSSKATPMQSETPPTASQSFPAQTQTIYAKPHTTPPPHVTSTPLQALLVSQTTPLTSQTVLVSQTTPLTMQAKHFKSQAASFMSQATPQTTPLKYRTMPLTSQTMPSTSQATPLASQATPITSQATSLTSQATPQASQATPLTSQATPLTSQATPLTSQATPLASQATFLASQATFLTSQATPLASQVTATSPVTGPGGFPVSVMPVREGKRQMMCITSPMNLQQLQVLLSHLKLPPGCVVKQISSPGKGRGSLAGVGLAEITVPAPSLPASSSLHAGKTSDCDPVTSVVWPPALDKAQGSGSSRESVRKTGTRKERAGSGVGRKMGDGDNLSASMEDSANASAVPSPLHSHTPMENAANASAVPFPLHRHTPMENAANASAAPSPLYRHTPMENATNASAAPSPLHSHTPMENAENASAAPSPLYSHTPPVSLESSTLPCTLTSSVAPGLENTPPAGSGSVGNSRKVRKARVKGPRCTKPVGSLVCAQKSSAESQSEAVSTDTFKATVSRRQVAETAVVDRIPTLQSSSGFCIYSDDQDYATYSRSLQPAILKEADAGQAARASRKISSEPVPFCPVSSPLAVSHVMTRAEHVPVPECSTLNPASSVQPRSAGVVGARADSWSGVQDCARVRSVSSESDKVPQGASTVRVNQTLAGDTGKPPVPGEPAPSGHAKSSPGQAIRDDASQVSKFPSGPFGKLSRSPESKHQRSGKSRSSTAVEFDRSAAPAKKGRDRGHREGGERLSSVDDGEHCPMSGMWDGTTADRTPHTVRVDSTSSPITFLAMDRHPPTVYPYLSSGAVTSNNRPHKVTSTLSSNVRSDSVTSVSHHTTSEDRSRSDVALFELESSSRTRNNDPPLLSASVACPERSLVPGDAPTAKGCDSGQAAFEEEQPLPRISASHILRSDDAQTGRSVAPTATTRSSVYLSDNVISAVKTGGSHHWLSETVSTRSSTPYHFISTISAEANNQPVPNTSSRSSMPHLTPDSAYEARNMASSHHGMGDNSARSNMSHLICDAAAATTAAPPHFAGAAASNVTLVFNPHHVDSLPVYTTATVDRFHTATLDRFHTASPAILLPSMELDDVSRDMELMSGPGLFPFLSSSSRSRNSSGASSIEPSITIDPALLPFDLMQIMTQQGLALTVTEVVPPGGGEDSG
ncbi:hypothetical protein ACOMHN_007340 [Nucella lapillus]